MKRRTDLYRPDNSTLTAIRYRDEILGPHWSNPPHSLRTVLIQSEQKGWKNHSGPLTSSTLPLWTVTVWSTLQSSEHQNDKTQEQFLSTTNSSHEHLTILNMEHTTLLYNYLFTTHLPSFLIVYIFLFQICTCQTSHIIVCIVYCIFAILYIAYVTGQKKKRKKKLSVNGVKMLVLVKMFVLLKQMLFYVHCLFK